MFIEPDVIAAVQTCAAELGVRAVESFRGAGFTDVAWEPCDGGALVAMGPGRFVNRAIGIGLGGTEPADIIDHVERFFEDLGLTPCVEVCPWAGDLIREMSSRGYVVDDVRDVYIHDLQTLPPRPSLEMCEVPGGDGLDGPLARTWIEILASNSERGSAEWNRDVEFFRIALQMPERINLLAVVDGTPCATGSVSIVDTMCEFGAATTVAEMRGRGAQQALIAERLHRAKELGCDHATAVAMPGGSSSRNLQRAGFTLLFDAILMRRP